MGGANQPLLKRVKRGCGSIRLLPSGKSTKAGQKTKNTVLPMRRGITFCFVFFRWKRYEECPVKYENGQASPLFAAGMINGCFKHDVPVQFWALLALYISSNILASAPWAIPFGPSQVQVSEKQTKTIPGAPSLQRAPQRVVFCATAYPAAHQN